MNSSLGNQARKGNIMDIETARGISARIWCDPDYSHVEMDVKLAEEIAYKLLECAQQAVEADAVLDPVCRKCGDPLTTD